MSSSSSFSSLSESLTNVNQSLLGNSEQSRMPVEKLIEINDSKQRKANKFESDEYEEECLIDLCGNLKWIICFI